MKKLTVLSLITGILCGLWTASSPSLGLLGWARFAGCTAFFAAGGKLKGFKSAITTAVITFVMCIQAKIKLFEFIPGTFIGSFSTFAYGGNWKAVVPALILGAILGLLCESGGTWLFNTTNKNIDSEENIRIS
ncbi:DUF1097 domain-containing protein [Clostridium sp.]|jgi:hypothetical protein|uniref:DUF1097 domain-containing protein n=1 Tax=Clostridium sp. TaxID=1506 RepID=UPI003EED1436